MFFEFRLASIDFCFPNIVTGSSDRQIRYFDLSTSRGWTTEAGTRVRPLTGMHGGANNHFYQQYLHWPAGSWTAPHTPMRYTQAAMAKWDELVRRSALSSVREHGQTCSCGAASVVGVGSSASGIRITAAPGAARGGGAMTVVGEEVCPTCGGEGHVPAAPQNMVAAVPHVNGMAGFAGGPVAAGGGLGATAPMFPNGNGNGNATATANGMSANAAVLLGMTRGHGDLVRAVAMSDDVVVSGSYDATIKVRP